MFALHHRAAPGRFWLCVRYLVSNAEAVHRKNERPAFLRAFFD